MIAALAVLAQTGGSDGIPLSGLGQLGAVGVILSIFFWFAWQVYKRERDRADRFEEKFNALQEKVADTYVPSMTQWAEALNEVKRALSEVRDGRRK